MESISAVNNPVIKQMTALLPRIFAETENALNMSEIIQMTGNKINKAPGINIAGLSSDTFQIGRKPRIEKINVMTRAKPMVPAISINRILDFEKITARK